MHSIYSCWSSNSSHFHKIWTFTGPFLVLLLVNYIIFASFKHKLSNPKRTGINFNCDPDKIGKIKKWRKRWLGLTILMSSTWTFAILSFQIPQDYLLYIFLILNTFQVVTFISFKHTHSHFYS